MREDGLQPRHVRAVLAAAAAAGGPKGLALDPLDPCLFGEWLAPATRPIHWLGASVGVWRMAAARLGDTAKAIDEMAQDWLAPVADIPVAAKGAYQDGGITGDHLHLIYASMNDGAPDEPALLLDPHFQQSILPGWPASF